MGWMGSAVYIHQYLKRLSRFRNLWNHASTLSVYLSSAFMGTHCAYRTTDAGHLVSPFTPTASAMRWRISARLSFNSGINLNMRKEELSTLTHRSKFRGKSGSSAIAATSLRSSFTTVSLYSQTPLKPCGLAPV